MWQLNALTSSASICLFLANNMKLLILIFSSSSLVLNVWSQPSPCVSPPLLVGSFSMIDPDGNLVSAGQYSYDALEEQIHITDSGTFENQPFSTDIILQFKQGVLYEINSFTSTCKKFALKSNFHPLRVPTNATFLSEIIYGTTSLPGMGLLINTWRGESPELNANYLLTFTQFSCLPISAVIYPKEAGPITLSFYNQVLGIQNPMDFIPPSICETAPMETENLPKTDFIRSLTSLAKN